jgi:hypothetical protein
MVEAGVAPQNDPRCEVRCRYATRGSDEPAALCLPQSRKVAAPASRQISPITEENDFNQKPAAISGP